jgi:hypothetical protein
MKKFLFTWIVTLIMFTTTAVSGQDCEIYEDYKEGTSTKMAHYDKKDKLTGYTTMTVKERKEIPGGVSLVFLQEYDDTEEYTFENEFGIECVNGEVKMDMSKMIDPNTLSAYENMDIDIVTDEMAIPAGASPGDKLNDGNVKVTVDTGTPVKVSINISMTNRLVEGKEEVTTPAGTFDCLKISYELLTQIGFIKVKSAVVEYYNKKHGVIKSESLDKKGKLTGYSVVEEINY